MSDQPLRASIEKKYLWNAESVYADHAAWQTEFEALSAKIPQVQAFAGTLAQGPAVIEAFLKLVDTMDGRMETLLFYATMSGAVDTADDAAQSLNGQAQSLYGRYLASVSFLEPELLALGEKTLREWFASTKFLVTYLHWLDDLLRTQKHVRSAEVEELLGSAAEVFGGIETIHRMQVDSDLKFAPAKDLAGKEWPVAQSTVEIYRTSPDRELRKNSWYSFCDSYLANGPSIAATLVTSIKKDAFLARARSYGSTLEAALFADNIPEAAFTNTLDTFAKHLSVWHRYWKVRAKALGLDRLQHWDIWAPLPTS